MKNKIKTRLTKSQMIEKKQRKMAKRDLYEIGHLGNYTRIYPASINNEYYERIILMVREYWEQCKW